MAVVHELHNAGIEFQAQELPNGRIVAVNFLTPNPGAMPPQAAQAFAAAGAIDTYRVFFDRLTWATFKRDGDRHFGVEEEPEPAESKVVRA